MITHGLCIFCKIINKEAFAKIVFENDAILAFAPIEPISKGHTLVVTKNHFENTASGREYHEAIVWRAERVGEKRD